MQSELGNLFISESGKRSNQHVEVVLAVDGFLPLQAK